MTMQDELQAAVAKYAAAKANSSDGRFQALADELNGLTYTALGPHRRDRVRFYVMSNALWLDLDGDHRVLAKTREALTGEYVVFSRSKDRAYVIQWGQLRDHLINFMAERITL